jgi:hypothetical protein
VTKDDSFDGGFMRLDRVLGPDELAKVNANGWRAQFFK